MAISGLPPLNGFVSELLIYIGGFAAAGVGAGTGFAVAVVGAASLSLIGGLAVACFTKAFGVVFLGEARTPHARDCSEVPGGMRAPMVVLAALCAGIGLGGPWVVSAMATVIGELAGVLGFAAPDRQLDTLRGTLVWVSVGSAGVLAAIALIFVVRRALPRASTVARAGTWGCGYAAPTSRMQYTASSFAQPLLDLFKPVVPAQQVRPGATRAVSDVRFVRQHAGRPGVAVPVPAAVLPGGRAACRIALGARGASAALPALHRAHPGLPPPVEGQVEVDASLDAVLRFAMAVALAPLLGGVVGRTKAFFAGRRGAPLTQGYLDLLKLLRKGAVIPRTTTWVFRAGPIVTLAATFGAMAVVPMGGAPALLAFPGDFLFLAYLLALARFFTVIAALDTGSAFEGMGASREVLFSALAEPGLVLCFMALARHAGDLSLSRSLGVLNADAWRSEAAVLTLVAAALFVVFLAECSRIPVDDPTTHLELTMIHEVMVLDHGGPDLAFIELAAALKMWVLAALVVGVVAPVRTGSVWLDGVAFVVAMFGLAVGVGVVESAIARLRLLRVPQLLVTSSVLAALATVLVSR